MKKIELLNSEGAILTAVKNTFTYDIVDQWGVCIDIVSESQLQNFVHGDYTVTDSKGREWKYSEQPGSMKPDLKKLDEFIGIDTTGKSY
jgi:hypothetical protein